MKLPIHHRAALLTLCAVLALPACSTSAAVEDPREDLEDRGRSGQSTRAKGPTHKLEGRASWYGADFHGRRTACGEPYNMNAFTAAHRSLPFHSVVRVTDTKTRKSVVVRINDRGPFARGRVIDVSRAAAIDLGLVDRGSTTVEIEVLSWGDGGDCI